MLVLRLAVLDNKAIISATSKSVRTVGYNFRLLPWTMVNPFN